MPTFRYFTQGGEPKRAIDAVTAATAITFSCHDLRRTFATLAESLDLSGYTVKALLNHKQQTGDVAGGYLYIKAEREQALQRLRACDSFATGKEKSTYGLT